jgi:hypothetical protein
MVRSVWIEVIRASGYVQRVDILDKAVNRKIDTPETAGLAIAVFAPVRDWLLSHWAENPERPFDHVLGYIPALRGVFRMGEMIVVEIGPTTSNKRPFDTKSRFYELSVVIASEFLRAAGLVDTSC